MVALLIVLVGCDGGQDLDAPGTEATAPEVGAREAGIGAEDDTAGARDDATGTETASPDQDRGAFVELLRHGTETAARVEYAVTGAGAGGTTYTYARTSGHESVRVEQGPQQTLVVVDEDGEDATCMLAREDRWTCVTMDADQAPVPPALGAAAGVVGELDLVETGDLEIVEEESIAGRLSVCARLVGSESDGGARLKRLCADRESGVVLALILEIGGELAEFQATDVSQPSVDDFSLPATPRRSGYGSTGDQGG